MSRFRKLFGQKKCKVIGMIHVGALPGTPCFKGSVQQLLENACEEAEIYKQCNVEGVIVENMHDVPYVQPKYMGPEITAHMTRICSDIRKILPTKIPCGVQILASGNKEALSVAQAAELQFIRAEGFVFGHVADEGYTDANAGPLLRFRSSIKADDILIFTDIKKKHSAHAITSDVSLQETAKAAEFFLADGVIITGIATGNPADAQELSDIKKCTKIPVLIGSGVTAHNVHKYFNADGIIVGTHFKDQERSGFGPRTSSGFSEVGRSERSALSLVRPIEERLDKELVASVKETINTGYRSRHAHHMPHAISLLSVTVDDGRLPQGI